MILAALLARFTYRKTLSWEFQDRWGAVLLIGFFFVTVFLLWQKVFFAEYYYHNWARLQKTFALAYGLPVYSAADSGAILTTLYGPVSYIGYLPAALFQEPRSVMRTAEILNLLYFFIPAYLLFLTPSRKDLKSLIFTHLLFLCFCTAPFFITSLRGAAFKIHVDAATLGLSAISCWFLHFRNRKFGRLCLVLSALCAVLAVWSKQVAVMLLPAMLFYLWKKDGWRILLFYAVSLAVMGFLVSWIFIAWFGFDPLFFNMFVIPGSQPWKDGGTIKIWKKTISYLLRDCFLIAGLGLISWVPVGIRKSSGSAPQQESFRSLYGWIGFFMVPVAVIGYSKVGGSENTLSYVTFFWWLAVMTAFGDWLQEPSPKPRWGKLQAKPWILFMAGVFFTIQFVISWIRIFTGFPEVSFAQTAYDYSKAHPGKVYYPTIPLINLLAERKLYHDVTGIMDRAWAGFDVRADHRDAYMPKSLEWVAFPEISDNLIQPFHSREFCLAMQKEELPGFYVYPRLKNC